MNLLKRLGMLQEQLDVLNRHDNDLFRSVLGMDSLPKEMKSPGYGGVDNYVQYETLNNPEMIIELAKKIDLVESKLNIQKNSYLKIEEFYKNKEEFFSQTPIMSQ